MIDLYLRYPGKYKPDAEYVDGRIVKRPPADWTHASWHGALLAWFSLRDDDVWNLDVLPSLRIRVAASRVRVPDISIFDHDQPVEQVPTYPPRAVFEVLSAEDSMPNMLEKFADFAAMGVQEIWLVEPDTKEFSRYADGKLSKQTHYGKSGDRIYFKLSEIEEYLD